MESNLTKCSLCLKAKSESDFIITLYCNHPVCNSCINYLFLSNISKIYKENIKSDDSIIIKCIFCDSSSSITRNKIIEISNINNSQCHSICDAHFNNKNISYCQKCNIAICEVCLYSDHKDHDYISLRNYINNKNIIEYNTIKENIDKEKKKINSVISKMSDDINTQYQERLKKLNDEYNSLNNFIIKVEDQFNMYITNVSDFYDNYYKGQEVLSDSFLRLVEKLIISDKFHAELNMNFIPFETNDLTYSLSFRFSNKEILNNFKTSPIIWIPIKDEKCPIVL